MSSGILAIELFGQPPQFLAISLKVQRCCLLSPAFTPSLVFRLEKCWPYTAEALPGSLDKESVLFLFWTLPSHPAVLVAGCTSRACNIFDHL